SAPCGADGSASPSRASAGAAPPYGGSAGVACCQSVRPAVAAPCAATPPCRSGCPESFGCPCGPGGCVIAGSFGGAVRHRLDAVRSSQDSPGPAVSCSTQTSQTSPFFTNGTSMVPSCCLPSSTCL